MTLKSFRFLVALAACIAPALASAQAANGLITGILVAGPNDPSHPDVVQIEISGGFTQPGCSVAYNAIRNTDANQDMIVFAYLAFATGIPVTVELNPADIYFPGRCAIVRMSATRPG